VRAGGVPLRPDTIRDLWAHAEGYLATAERELDPGGIRRGLLALAVAGSGGDDEGYRARVLEVRRVARKIGMDPVPLFDAAAAIVDPGDETAREILITTPRV
jgi:hypothetical protein